MKSADNPRASSGRQLLHNSPRSASASFLISTEFRSSVTNNTTGVRDARIPYVAKRQTRFQSEATAHTHRQADRRKQTLLNAARTPIKTTAARRHTKKDTNKNNTNCALFRDACMRAWKTRTREKFHGGAKFT